jgi:type III secretion protein N (ATPase)
MSRPWGFEAALDACQASDIVSDLLEAMAITSPLESRGRVVRARGTLLRASGLNARIGQQCRVFDPSGHELSAEVVGLVDGDALLLPMADLDGVSTESRVEIVGERPAVGFGRALIGRVIDAHGRPLDGRPMPSGLQPRPLLAAAPPALQRQRVCRAMPTGVRAIDGLLTMGVGQRTAILAAAGGGKSTLLGMLARGVDCDAVVIALIGERGREVREFVEDTLGPVGVPRVVIVAATADRPAMERVRAARAATALAEGFRAEGQHVLLLMDSITRWARALREIALATGEPPVRRGYPPSVFAEMPRLFERAGNDRQGSITAFYTVLTEDDDGLDPVAEEARSLLDGHIVLSRERASAGDYPAIDILSSGSRLFQRVTSPEHRMNADRLRVLLARHAGLRFLLQTGEYRAGGDPLADESVARWPRIEAWLRQRADVCEPFEQTLQSLREVLA